VAGFKCIDTDKSGMWLTPGSSSDQGGERRSIPPINFYLYAAFMPIYSSLITKMALSATKILTVSSKTKPKYLSGRTQISELAFHFFAKFGFAEGVAAHITFRDPVDPQSFWVNPLGSYFQVNRRRMNLFWLFPRAALLSCDYWWLVNRASMVVDGGKNRMLNYGELYPFALNAYLTKSRSCFCNPF